MTWVTEQYKKGRRRYGVFCKNTLTGTVVYVAYRWHREIFRSGKSTISDAMREGVACWAIDAETLQLAKIKGAKFVGVKLKDSGSIYLTKIEEFYNPSVIKVLNYSKRGGSLQKYLPVDCFRAIIKTSII
jgi:hypothetical protein